MATTTSSGFRSKKGASKAKSSGSSRRSTSSASEPDLDATLALAERIVVNQSTIEKARAIASEYRFTIERDDDGSFIAASVEMPLVFGHGKTLEACMKDVAEATAGAVGVLIAMGKRPPSPAREHKRDQQVNIRLSADEKFRLDEAARREGFRSLSDFMRAASLGRAS